VTTEEDEPWIVQAKAEIVEAYMLAKPDEPPQEEDDGGDL